MQKVCVAYRSIPFFPLSSRLHICDPCEGYLWYSGLQEPSGNLSGLFLFDLAFRIYDVEHVDILSITFFYLTLRLKLDLYSISDVCD